MYLGLHLNPLSETRDNLNFITDVKFSGLTCKYAKSFLTKNKQTKNHRKLRPVNFFHSHFSILFP